jgi:hypothetical protein
MTPKTGNLGQVFSGEFILAFLMFMMALIIIFTIWGNSTREVMGGESMHGMEEMAVDAAEQLVRTPGSPSDWGPQNVTSLGLANESRILLPSKVLMFIRYINDSVTDPPCTQSNYECNLHMLGIGGYDVFFNVSYLNGTTVKIDDNNIMSGKYPVNDTEKITVVRTALLNDEVSRIYLTVWK